jgi:hypothetical protein
MPMVVRRHSSGCVRIPDDGSVVVVASGGQRPAQASVGVLVPLPAGHHPPSIGAVAGLATGRQRATLPLLLIGRVCTSRKRAR